MDLNTALSELSQKNVLITGATGFTGACLTRKLVDAGARVRAIARNSSDRSSLSDLRVDWVLGSLTDAETISRATAGIHYIFHVAACFREAKALESDYHDVHVKSTQLLAEAVVGKPEFKRFIHVSTMGVHGHIENPPGNEESPYAPGDIYQVTKLEGELWLREFAAKTNLPFTIIRPCAIYGPGDKRLFKIFRMATYPLFPILGKGKCLYHLIHVEDLADAMILAAVHPKAVSEAFLVGNPEAIRLEDLARSVAKELKKQTLIVRIPVAPFFLLADLCEAVCKPLGLSPPIYRRRVAFYTKDRSFNTSKLRTLLGFTPRWSSEAGVQQTARWYSEQGWL